MCVAGLVSTGVIMPAQGVWSQYRRWFGSAPEETTLSLSLLSWCWFNDHGKLDLLGIPPEKKTPDEQTDRWQIWFFWDTKTEKAENLWKSDLLSEKPKTRQTSRLTDDRFDYPGHGMLGFDGTKLSILPLGGDGRNALKHSVNVVLQFCWSYKTQTLRNIA